MSLKADLASPSTGTPARSAALASVWISSVVPLSRWPSFDCASIVSNDEWRSLVNNAVADVIPTVAASACTCDLPKAEMRFDVVARTLSRSLASPPIKMRRRPMALPNMRQPSPPSP